MNAKGRGGRQKVELRRRGERRLKDRTDFLSIKLCCFSIKSVDMLVRAKTRKHSYTIQIFFTARFAANKKRLQYFLQNVKLITK